MSNRLRRDGWEMVLWQRIMDQRGNANSYEKRIQIPNQGGLINWPIGLSAGESNNCNKIDI